VCVCGCVCPSHAPHRTPAHWGWPGDRRSATSATPNGGGWPPLRPRLSLRHTVVLHDALDARHCGGAGRGLQQRPQGAHSPMVVPWAATREHLPRRPRARPRQSVLLVRPRRPEGFLGAVAHPGGAALRPAGDSEGRRPAPPRMGLPLCGMPPPPSHACPPLWGVRCGRPRGPLPGPADRRAPAASGGCRHREARLGLEGPGPRGPAPAGPAPPLGPWGLFAEGAARACAPRQPAGRLGRAGAGPGWRAPSARAPGARRSHHPVHTGARAKQAGRQRRGVTARRTAQPDMARQERAIPGTAEAGTPLALLCGRALQSGCCWQSGRLLETWRSAKRQRITRASHCANVVWPDVGLIHRG
jgi:hypothetical protein